jgi:hypothetical protein
LLDYVERIQVDGEPISHEQMIELVEEIKPAVAKIPKLTTFEITTAIAFLAFAKNECQRSGDRSGPGRAAGCDEHRHAQGFGHHVIIL